MLNPPTIKDFPNCVEIPERYLELLKYEQDSFLPWFLFDKEDLIYRYHGLQERYPRRELLPFARHDYSDDVACWEKGKPGRVIIIHDFASPGYENRYEFTSFDEWYQFILSVME